MALTARDRWLRGGGRHFRGRAARGRCLALLGRGGGVATTRAATGGDQGRHEDNQGGQGNRANTHSCIPP